MIGLVVDVINNIQPEVGDCTVPITGEGDAKEQGSIHATQMHFAFIAT